MACGLFLLQTCPSHQRYIKKGLGLNKPIPQEHLQKWTSSLPSVEKVNTQCTPTTESALGKFLSGQNRSRPLIAKYFFQWDIALPLFGFCFVILLSLLQEESILATLVQFGIRSGKTGHLAMEVDGLTFHPTHSEIITRLLQATLAA